MGKGQLSLKALPPVCPSPSLPLRALVALLQGPCSTKKHKIMAENANSKARPTTDASAASFKLGGFREFP